MQAAVASVARIEDFRGFHFSSARPAYVDRQLDFSPCLASARYCAGQHRGSRSTRRQFVPFCSPFSALSYPSQGAWAPRGEMIRRPKCHLRGRFPLRPPKGTSENIRAIPPCNRARTLPRAVPFHDARAAFGTLPPVRSQARARPRAHGARIRESPAATSGTAPDNTRRRAGAVRTRPSAIHVEPHLRGLLPYGTSHDSSWASHLRARSHGKFASHCFVALRAEQTHAFTQLPRKSALRGWPRRLALGGPLTVLFSWTQGVLIIS